MSLIDYKNIDDIKNLSDGVIVGETISVADKILLKISNESIDSTSIILDVDVIEMSIYKDADNVNLVEYISNVKNFIENTNIQRGTSYKIEDYFLVSNNSIFFRKDIFFEVFYPNLYGTIKVSFNFLRKKVFSDSFDDLVLFEISPSRTEGRIKYINNDPIDLNEKFQFLANTDISISKNLFVNFGNDNLSLVLNILIESRDSLIVKLYDPFSDSIKEKSGCYFCEKFINSYVTAMELSPPPSGDLEDGLLSLLPNFDITVEKNNNLKYTYNSLDDLVSTTNSSEILAFLSSSSDELKIDYNNYDNFIFYASAEKKLSNFKYKLNKIEDYQSDISNNSLLTQSLDVASSSIKLTSELNNVKASFTPYEDYLYYESSSYFTGSYGEFFERSWPKSNTSKPHLLYSISSSKAIDWYNKEIVSASRHDNKNLNYLRNTIPLFIRDDSYNDDYLNFADMIAEFFDEIYLYIKNLTNKNINQLQKNKGMSTGILSSLITQFGSALFSEFDEAQVSELFLNYDSAGNFTTSSLNPISVNDQKNILYKKFLNNLIYFLKTKGTINNIHSLANMFGISREYYEIREYGGKDVAFKDFNTQSIQESSLEYTNLEYALRFSGSQNVKLLWTDAGSKKPDTILFKFKLNSTTPASQSLFESKDRFAVIAEKTSTSTKTGVLKFLLTGSDGIKSASTSELPIFDGGFWNVMLKRSNSTNSNAVNQTYTLVTDSIKFDKLMFYTSSALSITGSLTSSYNQSYNTSSNFYIGSNLPTSSFLSCAPFSGEASTLKFYNVILRDDVFKKHSLSETLLISNNISSSYDDLVTYLKFDDNKNLALTSSLYDSNTSVYGKNHATASSFSGNTYTSRFEKSIVKSKTLRLNNATSTKIRIDNNQISGSDGLILLNNNVSIESSSFSKYGLDSNNLDIIFSPSNIENKNIISQLDYDVNEFIGDPTLLFDDVTTYTQLEALYKNFRKNNPAISLQNYIDNIEKLIKTFIKNLPNFAAERINLRAGISIEPNILERTHVVLNKSVDISNLTHFVSLGDIPPTSSAEYLLHSVTLSDFSTIPTASYFLHSAILQDFNTIPTASYFLHSYNLSVIDNIVPSGTYDFKGLATLIESGDRYILQGPKRKILRESSISSSSGPVFYNSLSTGSVFESATGSIILPISDFKYSLTYNTSSGFFESIRNSAMEPLYDANYNTYYAANHIRYYIYRSIGYQRSSYIGTTNTGPEHIDGASTIDGKSVIEITYISPNKLSVVSQAEDKPRLKVDGIDLEI